MVMKSILLKSRTMQKSNILSLGFAMLLFSLATIARAVEFVSNFDPTSHSNQPIPPNWQIIRLESHVPATVYRQRYWDGINAIEANADASMALLGRLVDIDLYETPMLCWLWRTDGVVKSANMAKRQGDDYAARVYLAFSLPKDTLTLADKAALTVARAVFGSQVPDGAINYVWDNIHPAGTRMPNAYTSRAQMVVLRTGNSDSGKWVAERVNVLDDLLRTFGTTGAKLKLLAIASDSDNTKERVRAGFAEIAFVRADEACPTTVAQN